LSISSRNRRRGEGILDRLLAPAPSADGETFLSSRNSRLWLEKDFALSDGAPDAAELDVCESVGLQRRPAM
jgi:hypothetical protein